MLGTVYRIPISQEGKLDSGKLCKLPTKWKEEKGVRFWGEREDV